MNVLPVNEKSRVDKPDAALNDDDDFGKKRAEKNREPTLKRRRNEVENANSTYFYFFRLGGTVGKAKRNRPERSFSAPADHARIPSIFRQYRPTTPEANEPLSRPAVGRRCPRQQPLLRQRW
jgi:hypothetical protein